MTSLNSQLLVAKGQPRIVLANFLLQAIVMPIAFYLGSRYGLTGVSAAWVVVWPLLAALMTWQTLRVIELDLSAYVGALKHPVIGSVVMALTVSIVQLQLPADAAVTRLAVSVGLGAVVYVGYILAFDKVALHDARDIVRAARAGRRAPPAAVEATA